MQPARPPAIKTVTVIAIALAVLTIASWSLHLEFSGRFGQLGLAGHVRIEGVSAETLSRIGELGKALALVGAGAVLVLRVRGGRGRARVAVVIGMAGAAAAYGLAALYEGVFLLVGFLFAALASVANALTGTRGLPGSGQLSVGLAAVTVDVVSLVLALTCVVLVCGRSAVHASHRDGDGPSRRPLNLHGDTLDGLDPAQPGPSDP